MNNAKMWLVVSPSVGVPVFLGAVALGSFAVHVAVVSNTTWVADFLSGQELGAGEMQASATMLAPDMEAAQAAYVIDAPAGSREVTVILADGTVTQAILQTEEVLASATLEAPSLLLDN